jgi:hypothetical protein
MPSSILSVLGSPARVGQALTAAIEQGGIRVAKCQAF